MQNHIGNYVIMCNLLNANHILNIHIPYLHSFLSEFSKEKEGAEEKQNLKYILLRTPNKRQKYARWTDKFLQLLTSRSEKPAQI